MPDSTTPNQQYNPPQTYQQAPQQPNYQQPGYQQPGYQQPTYHQTTYVTNVNAAPSTNILAIIGFILSLVGFNVISLILCYVSLGQIKRTGEAGKGLAIAGIIISWIAVSILVLMIVFWVIAVVYALNSGYYNSDYYNY